MSTRLVVEWQRRRFVIAWFDSDDGETGLVLGPELDQSDDAETKAAVVAILALDGNGKPDGTDAAGLEWEWESERRAKTALKVAKAAVSALQAARPMPEWAMKATEAGWKPPKGWKP